MKRIFRVLLFIAMVLLIVMCVISIGQGITKQEAEDKELPELIEDGNTTPRTY